MLVQCFASGQATKESSTSAPNSSSKRSLCFTCRNHENRFHKIHPRYSHCLRNGKLRLVKVQWSKYKTWRFQVSCWKLSKVPRAVRAVHFCLLFLRHQGHEQLHLITAMPSHSHEPHDSHNLSCVHHDTHVHTIHPHWKPNQFLHKSLLETTSFLTLLTLDYSRLAGWHLGLPTNS